VASSVQAGLLSATSDFARIPEVDVIIICVPTPLNRHHEPDLSYVRATRDTILPHLRAGQLVCLESTTYPGTTEEEFLGQIEGRGFTLGKDYFLVFSPEREDPGNPEFHGTGIPKVVGGHTAACLEQGVAVYGAIYGKVVPVTSTRVAEMVKLLENIFRAVNIGLVNEMKTVADAMGIDIWEVIDAAKTKPFGFTAFYPGPGLGGHCIPIDPFYLTWKAREFGIHTRFIELAGEINEGMPGYVVRRVAERLNRDRKALNGSRILVMGLAYKANVDDMRESPTFHLFDLLKAQGAEIAYHDPHIPVVTPTREHAEYTGMKSIAWDRETVGSFDLVLISTHHAAVDLEELAAWAPCIVDTRNAMAKVRTSSGQVTKA
jgi:UDP-N-acetyl-D-glucosamine dehydrogenase